MTNTVNPQSMKLRITRRGRIVLGLLLAILVAAVIAISILAGTTAALASTENSDVPVAFTTVVAMPGDSLWSVATRVAPEADPRDVIAEIQRLNQFQSSDLIVGQELAIPLKYA